MFSQVLTLFTTPVIYLWFGRMAAWISHRRRSETDSLPLPELT